MSSLDNLNERLQFNGGNQEGRMQAAKLRSLKKSLIYSYQACTAVLQDGREFRCLINPDKTKEDYDDKILSIPYRDVCLNKTKENEDDKTWQGEEEIGMKVGDTFEWKETGTHWLVYLENLEEDAYFRAEIRRADDEVEIDGTKYWVSLIGPDQTEISWHTRRDVGSWNDLNYKATMYVTANEQTRAFFHRFSVIKIRDKNWEVQVVDDFSTDGILQLFLKEWFENSIQDAAIAEKIAKAESEDTEDQDEEGSATTAAIQGDTIVYPYDVKEYTISNAEGGVWDTSNNKAVVINQDETSATVEIIATKSGTVDLIYSREDEDDIVLNIIIKSL